MINLNLLLGFSAQYMNHIRCFRAKSVAAQDEIHILLRYS